MSSRFPAPTKLIHEPSTTGGGGSITEDGLYLNDCVFVHHGTGFGDGTLTRVQLHLNELHLLSDDLVVDQIGATNPARRRRRSWNRDSQLGYLSDRLPVRQAFSPGMPVGIGLSLSLRLGQIKRATLIAAITYKPLSHFLAPFTCRASNDGRTLQASTWMPAEAGSCNSKPRS